jgi:hypothetical protein
MVSPGVAKFGTYEFQLDSNAMVKSVADLVRMVMIARVGGK